MIHPNSREAFAATPDERERQRVYITGFLKTHTGFTSNELGELSPKFDRYQFARRLPEMRDKGATHNPISRPCLVSGRTAMTWALSV